MPEPRLVLASASPRRRELLAELVEAFEVRPAEADERPLPGEKPEAMVIRLALAKARAIAGDGELTLGADTVVALGDEIFGKPADAAEASAMLARLSGRTHEVWTGVALVAKEESALRERACAERSRVVFRPITPEEIAAYVASGEPLDRAGAYAIQGGAAPFVETLEGSWSNVVGLPVERVRELLASFSRRT
jgi:septum formation protein